MNIFLNMRTLVVTLFLSLVAFSHAGMLSNGTFDQGNWEIRESPQGDWLSLRADGSAAPKGTSETGNYGQSAVGTLNTPGLTSIAAHLQARGGNAIRQTFQQVDAGTFDEFQVSLRLGYRRDAATRGDLTLRVSLLDPLDGSLFTFQDLTLPDPGVGANSLTLENLALSVDRETYAGRPIAIQFANITPNVPIGDAWMGTLIIDDVMVNPTTPRVAANAEMSAAVHGVIERLLPGRQGEFSFAIIPPDQGRDVFEIESGAEGTVVIRGNRTLSLVSGFHWYLKHTAKCHVSWNGNQLAFASPAPAPQGLIRQVSPYKHRNQGNVTVGSYTQAFWDWERWEKEIDFMALNGITQAVVIPGHQKIWQNTLRRLNFSEADLAAYIPNLGHAAWWLFGNLEGDGGPLPQEVIDGEAVLGQQIVSRMRELGIEPILFGYVGFVPTTFPNYFPNAHVVPQGLWMNYRRPDVLSPLDPQFASVAAIWYEELATLFGEANFLTGDLFHEGGNSGGLNLTQAAAAVHASMLNALPDSTWLIQAWGGNPDPSLIAGTDFHHTLVQQLISDMTTGKNDAGTLRTFQDRPWTWNEISNFGGNNVLPH